MDKQEYKILSEEIMTLVANEQFVEAAEIADRIDWRKVRSFSTLQKISELYRINRRFDEAMDIMLLAYDRNPNSRTIVYSLCELSIDMDDLVSALQYLAMYKKMAPNDKGALILQYKILEMENAKTEDKIEILEELNRKDYTEEWAYQLAYLYHRIGLATKCVETCDQLITWFGYGPFVIKAIELKMLHAPLTEKQKEIYDKRNDISDEIEAYESDEYTVERAESSVAAEMGTEDFHVKTIDMGKFNTLNLQKALAESMRELMGEEEVPEEESPLVSTGELEQRLEGSGRHQHDEELSYEDLNYEEEQQDTSYEYEGESGQETYYEEDMEPLYEETYEPIDEPQGESRMSDQGGHYEEDEVFFEDKTSDIVIDTPPAGTIMPEQRRAAAAVMKESREARMEGDSNPSVEESVEEPVPSAEPVVEVKEHEKVERKQTSSVFDNVLSQGMDGQISLVVPTDTDTVIEKQITGQMNLQQVLQEWENVKKRKEEERKEKTSQSILEETGKIFADFEAGARTGPLAKIEEEHKMFASRFHDDEIELRSIDAVENASGGSSIWDEVDAAIEADKKAAEAPDLAGAAVVGTAVAAGVAAAGEMAGAGVAIAEGVAAVAGEAAAAGAAMAADAVIEGGEAVAEGIADAAESEELSAYGQAASDVLNDESFDESEQPETAAEPEAEEMTDGFEEMEVPDDTETPIEKEEEDLPEDMGEEEGFSDQDQTLPVNEQLLDTSQIDDIGSALEAEADKVGANTAEEDNDNYAEEEDHYLTPEEQNLFSDFMYSKKMRNQILDAIDLISLAPYVGNVIITGDSGTGVIELAKAMIKEIQMIDNNFSASRVAKISGDKMNRKDLAAMFNQLTNGALIVEHAGAMTKDTLENMSRLLEGFQEGIIIILTDTKKDIEKLIARYDLITGYFNARIDIKPMNDSALVDYAKKYALTREYKIDEERAVLALHRRINELQIGEHNVTTREIEDIVDEAIERSKRLRLSTYVDILVGKRYDYEDMIILREKDFD